MIKSLLRLIQCSRSNILLRVNQRKCHVLCQNDVTLFPNTSVSGNHIVKRTRKHNRSPPAPSLFVPVPVKNNPDDINVGAELAGKIKKQDLIRILATFYQKPEIKLLCVENGLDDQLLHQAFLSFRRHCLDEDLASDLHVIISDILQGIQL